MKIAEELELCQLFQPDIQLKKKKRRHGSSEVINEYAVSQPDVDGILSSLKVISSENVESIKDRVRQYFAGHQMWGISYTVSCSSCPFYLLGRYRKLARDVPQAAWTIDSQRKGRFSVEEIISEAVCASLGASTCRMHACGREDIDVRCLGKISKLQIFKELTPKASF